MRLVPSADRITEQLRQPQKFAENSKLSTHQACKHACGELLDFASQWKQPGHPKLKERSRAAAMESTTPATAVTDAQAASTEVAPPAGPADAKPPAPTLDVSDAPQPTEAKPPKLEISPRAQTRKG